jgi:hypothetical protein
MRVVSAPILCLCVLATLETSVTDSPKEIAIVSLSNEKYKPCLRALLDSVYSREHGGGIRWDFFIIAENDIADIVSEYPVKQLPLLPELRLFQSVSAWGRFLTQQSQL